MARDGLFKRGAIWWVRTDPITGKQVSTRCRDRKAAEQWRRGRERLATGDPAHAAAATETLKFWCRKVIAAKQANRSPATVEVYKQKLGHWLRVLGTDAVLADVTPAAVDAYREQRLSEEVTDHTIHKELGAMVQVLKAAKRAGAYPGDIAALRPLDMAVNYQPRNTTLDALEVVHLLTELRPHRQAVVKLAIGLGLRLGELYRLRPEDIDIEAGTVRVRGTKTQKARRVLPVLSLFSDTVRTALPYLPLQPWGKLHRDLARACVRAGVPVVTPNDLRRTHATLLRDANVDKDNVRRLLGHASTSMLETVYDAPKPAQLRERIEADMAARTQQVRNNEDESSGLDEESSEEKAPPARFEHATNGLGSPRTVRRSGREHATTAQRSEPKEDDGPCDGSSGVTETQQSLRRLALGYAALRVGVIRERAA